MYECVSFVCLISILCISRGELRWHFHHLTLRYNKQYEILKMVKCEKTKQHVSYNILFINWIRVYMLVHQYTLIHMIYMSCIHVHMYYTHTKEGTCVFHSYVCDRYSVYQWASRDDIFTTSLCNITKNMKYWKWWNVKKQNNM